jgi:hypothetical protein
MARLRFIQHRETGELIPIGEAARRELHGPYIAPDIEPYRVPGTNEWHTSRRHRREYMRREGLEEIGNEKPTWMRESEYRDRHR